MVIYNHFLNPFTTKYLNIYVVPSAEYLSNHNDPMFNFLDDIILNELVWQVVFFWKVDILIFNCL